MLAEIGWKFEVDPDVSPQVERLFKVPTWSGSPGREMDNHIGCSRLRAVAAGQGASLGRRGGPRSSGNCAPNFPDSPEGRTGGRPSGQEGGLAFGGNRDRQGGKAPVSGRPAEVPGTDWRRRWGSGEHGKAY